MKKDKMYQSFMQRGTTDPVDVITVRRRRRRRFQVDYKE